MIVSLLIIAVSVALFAYWFRYTCALILSTRTTRDYSGEFAAVNDLCFLEIQERLPSAGASELASLFRSLENDYQRLEALSRQAGEIPVGSDTMEDLILRIDFQLMKAWYTITRPVFTTASRAALGEMTQIVAYVANTCGARAAGVAD